MNIGRVGGRLIAGVALAVTVLCAFVGPASAADGDITEYHLDTKFGISDVQSMIAGPDGNLWFPVTDGIGDHFGRLTPSGAFWGAAAWCCSCSGSSPPVFPDRAR